MATWDKIALTFSALILIATVSVWINFINFERDYKTGVKPSVYIRTK